MSKSPKFAVHAVATLVLSAGLAGVAVAQESQWEKHHPRRDQVNDRLENQNKRINKDLKQGDITQQQAAALHKDDRGIRQEERDMARIDGGHITALDQKALNQQENTLSKDITSGKVPGSGMGGGQSNGQWAKTHPRRDEVNDRLANQNRRIRQEVQEGDLSKAQAATLHHDDRAIRQEERDMAHLDGGHITKLDQAALNQQENAVSKDIGK